MKKTTVTILITATVTAVVLLLLFVIFMPTIGPRLMHNRMTDTMPANMPGHMMMNSDSPAGLDTATDRLTDNGLFRVSYVSDLDPIAINQMQSWILHVETADGQPVENAAISVGGGMPQHGHGLPTRPQVTEYLGDGNYRVEGLRFQMGGWWEVSFSIDDGSQQDTITFNIVLRG
jgi:hypothetical protein